MKEAKEDVNGRNKGRRKIGSKGNRDNSISVHHTRRNGVESETGNPHRRSRSSGVHGRRLLISSQICRASVLLLDECAKRITKAVNLSSGSACDF